MFKLCLPIDWYMQSLPIDWVKLSMPGKLKKITTLQKKCIRNVAGKGHRSHTGPLCAALNILKFEDLYRYNCLNFMHRYVTNRQPSSFIDFFSPFPNPNRTKGFHEDKLRLVFLSQFPTYQLPKLWNLTCLTNKQIESHKVFKKTVIQLTSVGWVDYTSATPTAGV